MSMFQRIDVEAARRTAVADPRELVDALVTQDRATMTVLKDDPSRSVVYRAEHGGLSWVLKIYRHQSRWKMLLRQSPAWREWRLARRAARVPGLRVSVPVAIVTLSNREQALILPYVAGEPMHQMVTTCTDRVLRLQLARAVGRQVRTMLEAGLVNRDHKLSNLIADARCLEGKDVPVMIDPLGVQWKRSEDQVFRMWVTLLRTTLREGPISAREGITCLKAGGGNPSEALAILSSAKTGRV